MGFFEKLLRGVAGSHGGGHHGRDSSGHHGWGNSYPESPWELRRLHYLRKWSHYEQDEAIFPGSQRACCPLGA